jgi:hypothetical protein
MEEGLTIRTMKDDVAEFRNQKEQRVDNSVSIRPIPAHHSAARRVGVIVSILVCLIIVGAGGWYGYRTVLSSRSIPVLSEGNVTIQDVIPKDATAIVEYNATSDPGKAVIQEMWGAASQGEGSPTAFLAIDAVSRIYYFSLPGDSGPFIAVRKDNNSQKIISQLSGVQFGEQGGWYTRLNTGCSQCYDAWTRRVYCAFYYPIQFP